MHRQKIIFRILILVAIFIISIIYYSYNCIILKFTSVPNSILDNIKDNEFSLFLVRKNICPPCPIGEYLLDYANKSIIIVPDDFSDIDIDNLRYAFNIKAVIIREDFKTKRYFEKIASCIKKSSGKNWYIEIIKKKKIKTIKNF